MALDDLGHNIEPHAQTRDSSLLSTRRSIETLKNFISLLSRYAQTMIVHPDSDRIFGGLQVYLDRVRMGRILDGIREQVAEDLPEPVSISRQTSLRLATHQQRMAGIE